MSSALRSISYQIRSEASVRWLRCGNFSSARRSIKHRRPIRQTVRSPRAIRCSSVRREIDNRRAASRLSTRIVLSCIATSRSSGRRTLSFSIINRREVYLRGPACQRDSCTCKWQRRIAMLTLASSSSLQLTLPRSSQSRFIHRFPQPFVKNRALRHISPLSILSSSHWREWWIHALLRKRVE